MTRIITLELLPQGNLDSSRADNQGSHIPSTVKVIHTSWLVNLRSALNNYIYNANLIQLNFTNINNLSDMYM